MLGTHTSNIISDISCESNLPSTPLATFAIQNDWLLLVFVSSLLVFERKVTEKLL